MKFNFAIGLAAVLYLAPNAVAWRLPGLEKRQDATPTSQIVSGSEPTGTFPSSFPSGSVGGGDGQGGSGGASPSSGAQPSGGFGGSGGHGSGSHRPGPRPTGAAPSGSASGGEGGASPSGTAQSGGGHGGQGGNGGQGGGQSSFVTVPAGPTATPEANSQGKGESSESSEGEQGQRVHARHFRAY